VGGFNQPNDEEKQWTILTKTYKEIKKPYQYDHDAMKQTLKNKKLQIYEE
tara:strand:- start:112 stop:261 length:150 start_codon:yes stop_codon:yes gene_type:complete